MSSCHSLKVLYPGHKHCIQSKLLPYFPQPLLFYFFFIICFNETMEKMWKNLDTDSSFDENSKTHKPTHPPPPLCPLFADRSGPDFWRCQGDFWSLPSTAACCSKLAGRGKGVKPVKATSPTFWWSMACPAWLDSQDPGTASPVTASARVRAAGWWVGQVEKLHTPSLWCEVRPA